MRRNVIMHFSCVVWRGAWGHWLLERLSISPSCVLCTLVPSGDCWWSDGIQYAVMAAVYKAVGLQLGYYSARRREVLSVPGMIRLWLVIYFCYHMI